MNQTEKTKEIHWYWVLDRLHILSLRFSSLYFQLSTLSTRSAVSEKGLPSDPTVIKIEGAS